MIDFQPITPAHKGAYEHCLFQGAARGCEYTFANLFLWGRQKIAFLDGFAVIFSQFARKSVYSFPVGQGDLKKATDAIIADAAERGIPCRLTGLSREECEILEHLYPKKFCFHIDRDSFDYIYNIDDLAHLKGKKYQKKRNHLNRFRLLHRHAVFAPLTDENTADAEHFLNTWYDTRLQEDPTQDFQMETAAIFKALKYWQALHMEGMLLYIDGKAAAITLGSRASEQTFDIHFEKALQRYDGAYTAINQGFAKHLQEQYPAVLYLNREDDMGLEGLRKAKLSYQPAFMHEKYWAHLLEDGYDY